MKLLFWTSLALIFYTYFVYPLLVLILSRIFRSPIRRGIYEPSVALIIPAYNESAVLEEKLRNALSLRYPREKLEIIVASDGSSDETNEIARRFASEGVQLFDAGERKGKNALLNDVIPGTRAEIVVISDANIELEPDALRQLVGPLFDTNVGGAWGDKVYRNPGQSAAGEGESLYLQYEKLLKSAETRLGSIVAGECSFLGFKRELFREIPAGVPDDFYLSTSVLAGGKRLVYAQESRTYESTSPTGRDEFRRKIRIIQQGVLGFFRVLPLANPFRTGFYSISLITRQLLRRLVALFIVLAVVSLPFLYAEGWIYRVGFWLTAAFIVLAMLGTLARGKLRRAPFFFIPHYFVLVNLASLIGMARCVGGSKSVTWRPTSRVSSAENEEQEIE